MSLPMIKKHVQKLGINSLPMIKTHLEYNWGLKSTHDKVTRTV